MGGPWLGPPCWLSPHAWRFVAGALDVLDVGPRIEMRRGIAAAPFAQLEHVGAEAAQERLA